MTMQEKLGDYGSGILYAPHKSTSIIEHIKGLLSEAFPNPVSFYKGLNIQEYRKLIKKIQEQINTHNYVRKIATEVAGDIREHIGEDRFFMQTNLYVRATRPIAVQETETIGWHRESFYGPNMEKSFNVWTPVSGVHANNTLRYIPQSQLIVESNIGIEQTDDAVTTKGSVGNIIGFFFSLVFCLKYFGVKYMGDRLRYYREFVYKMCCIYRIG